MWSVLPHISSIFIDPNEYQGRQDVGSRMLSFLEEYLREQGCRKLVSSSEIIAPRSQAWHRKVGFKDIGTLAGLNDDGVGEVFFLKTLQKSMSPADLSSRGRNRHAGLTLSLRQVIILWR